MGTFIWKGKGPALKMKAGRANETVNSRSCVEIWERMDKHPLFTDPLF